MLSLSNIDKNNSGRTMFTLMGMIVRTKLRKQLFEKAKEIRKSGR